MRALMREAATMQVVDLSSAVDRLSCEKVDLERQFEMEVWLPNPT